MRILSLLGMMLAFATMARAEVEPSEARKSWLRGKYGEAFEAYKALEDKPVISALGQARCLRAEGQDESARRLLAAALEKSPDDPELLAALAEVDWDAGRVDQALARADAAIAKDERSLPARWIRAQVLSARGQFDQANGELKWFIDFYNAEQPTEPETLLLVARAAAEYARRNKIVDEFDFILNELLPDAAADEDFWPASWFAGLLLVEKYNKAEGLPELRKALAINPSAAAALVGVGMVALQDYDFVEGMKFADQALEINPRCIEALDLKADLLLTDSRTESARDELKRSLAINGTREETLGRLAAALELLGERGEVERIEREVLARNPRPGNFYLQLAEPLEKRRHFDTAEGYYKKAIEATPHLAAAWNGLGLLYMRIGREEEAKTTFAEARTLDPFHVRASNMAKVLDHMATYQVETTPHYRVSFDPAKDRLLGQYMAEFLEAKHPELCKRFGYDPPDPTKIEVMVDHKWFSARVVGLPSIGTVGACTGKVVALASPRSLRSPYNWARVLTHEVTHIITLQQTNFNIPHWYTEALAVLSEGYPRSATWNQLLAERVPKRDLFNLDNINHSFVRPKTPLDWQMAYCQSLLYAEYMIAQHGEPSLARLLDAYRDGLETDAAVPRAFGVSKAQFEEGYLAHLDKVVAELPPGLARTKRTFAETERAQRAKPDDPDLAAELAEHLLARKDVARARQLARRALDAAPGNPLALFVLAKMEWSIGKGDEALRILEPALAAEPPNAKVLELAATIHLRGKEYDRAARLYERARGVEPGETRYNEGLARVYLLQGDDEKLQGVLETIAGTDSDNLAVRKKLAELAARAKRWDDAARWANESLHVAVADPEAHRLLGEASLARQDFARAARELEVFDSLAEDEDKKWAARVPLAEAYLGLGEKEKARETLRLVLERRPDDPAARALAERLGEP